MKTITYFIILLLILGYLIFCFNKTKKGVLVFKKIESFTKDDAKRIGNILKLDWNKINIDQFTMGLNVELEHGLRSPATNITNDDEIETAKIALAHLNEFPDYYTRLAKLEKEADEYWKGKK